MTKRARASSLGPPLPRCHILFVTHHHPQQPPRGESAAGLRPAAGSFSLVKKRSLPRARKEKSERFTEIQKREYGPHLTLEPGEALSLLQVFGFRFSPFRFPSLGPTQGPWPVRVSCVETCTHFAFHIQNHLDQSIKSKETTGGGGRTTNAHTPPPLREREGSTGRRAAFLFGIAPS